MVAKPGGAESVQDGVILSSKTPVKATDRRGIRETELLAKGSVRLRSLSLKHFSHPRPRRSFLQLTAAVSSVPLGPARWEQPGDALKGHINEGAGTFLPKNAFRKSAHAGADPGLPPSRSYVLCEKRKDYSSDWDGRAGGCSGSTATKTFTLGWPADRGGFAPANRLTRDHRL